MEGVCFSGPTEVESESHLCPKKRNYSETFERAPFVGTTLLPERTLSRRFKRRGDVNFCYKQQTYTKTVPNLKGFFGMHPKAVTMEDLSSWTNTKAMMANAESGDTQVL